jgi:hypothetical protein
VKRNEQRTFVDKIQGLQSAMDGYERMHTKLMWRKYRRFNEQWMDVKRIAHRTFVEKIQGVTMSNDWVCTGMHTDREIRIQANLY